jgi:hypothetical protein
VEEIEVDESPRERASVRDEELIEDCLTPGQINLRGLLSPR